ncbi:transforming growth factor beta-1-induced transcript 1 protein isoform X2 [Bombina bombina]|uniref:transforming growth factor beta-1-induced transcript 1 protein isoform X2 n=1 Tax=Bombina bombina TaxID=8345 RepID=UPI00235B0AAF|nr:transforming growth factor beta-1-induced transcript 1 protein isoform X2 [Bombina bombina]
MDDLDALLADLQFTAPPRCPVLLCDSPEKPEANETRPPPPSYDPKISVSYMPSDVERIPVKKDYLYSTVQKPPISSSSPLVGGGLCELDRLLNELNATQFNITDEIMSQFPSNKNNDEKAKDEKRALSASSATLELDRLMTSLSDFHKQKTASPLQSELKETLSSKESNVLSSTAGAEVELDPSYSACRRPEAELVSKHSDVACEKSDLTSVSHPSDKEPLSGSNYSQKMSPSRGDLDSMLVTLKSGLQRQGIETDAKGLCHSCQRPIAGQVVTALGFTWHPEHFACAHCHSLIGSTNFFEKDGKPYCERDYFLLHAPRCALCELPILQNMITALGRTWHPEHFCCKICKKQIAEEGFHEQNGDQYCADDFFRLFGAICTGCSEPVKERYISALGSLWHPQCFVCNVCKTPFVSGSFFENDGLPLCETHYHSVRGSLCAGCDQPITGRCVTAMGKKFHPQHLSCTFCLRQLNKGTFREHEGKPYCQACYTRLYG